MSKFSAADQTNAMTTLMMCLLRTLNERSIMTNDEILAVVRGAVAMCDQGPDGSGAKKYLEEVYLQNFREP